jgi:hypothetical protein
MMNESLKWDKKSSNREGDKVILGGSNIFSQKRRLIREIRIQSVDLLIVTGKATWHSLAMLVSRLATKKGFSERDSSVNLHVDRQKTWIHGAFEDWISSHFIDH